jgi:nitrite reductase/ring-hydroxylating ferredoxin subunit
MKQPLIPVDEIPTEGSASVEFFGRPVHVVRGPGSVPAAYLDVCLHLGGPLSCENGRFECAWHGAAFGLDGKRIEGPAATGDRLMRLPTTVEDGVLTYVYGE